MFNLNAPSMNTHYTHPLKRNFLMVIGPYLTQSKPPAYTNKCHTEASRDWSGTGQIMSPGPPVTVFIFLQL